MEYPGGFLEEMVFELSSEGSKEDRRIGNDIWEGRRCGVERSMAQDKY